jgi:hypothetical protein
MVVQDNSLFSMYYSGYCFSVHKKYYLWLNVFEEISIFGDVVDKDFH